MGRCTESVGSGEVGIVVGGVVGVAADEVDAEAYAAMDSKRQCN